MTFRPLYDHVVVRRVEAADKTGGRVILPDTAVETPEEGEIVAVGDGARQESGSLRPRELKAGDRILFDRRSGVKARIEGQDLLIMKQSDVMGVFESASAMKTRAAWPRARLA